jgi:N-acetylglucosamine-6-phosphate deacetylase
MKLMGYSADGLTAGIKLVLFLYLVILLMKSKILIISVLFHISLCVYAEIADTSYVEGLLYLDGTPVSLKISDGKIVKIIPLPAGQRIPENYIAPGLIDLQINGYMGVSFGDQDLSVDDIRKVTHSLWKEGVTSFLPTVTTSDQTQMETSFSQLAKALADEEIGSSLPGFHLEGPYISPVKGYRGAHSEKYIRLPDWEEFQRLQSKASGAIKLITVAPEMEGAIPFIEKCHAEGTVVSLGHHNASTEIIQKAVDAGASLSTHLGNGCANEINRHNNPIWPQLANDKLSISIITDGSHLNRDEVITFYKAKGVDKTIIVSDALSLAGLPPGEYISDGDTLLVTEDVVMFPSEGVLVGAIMPVSRCMATMMRFTQCSLKDAVQMSSTNPARLMGLDDRGEIKPGKRADLILFTLEDGDIVIQKTIVEGKVVYSK